MRMCVCVCVCERAGSLAQTNNNHIVTVQSIKCVYIPLTQCIKIFLNTIIVKYYTINNIDSQTNTIVKCL